MKKLTMIFMLMFALVATGFAQSADLSVSAIPHPHSNFITGEIVFQLGVDVLRDRALDSVTATGVILSIEIPNGATATPLYSGAEICDFADGFLTCDLGELTSGGIHGRQILFKVKAADGARALSVTAKVMANEFDPNVSNNTYTRTVLLKTTRNKHIRAF